MNIEAKKVSILGDIHANVAYLNYYIKQQQPDVLILLGDVGFYLCGKTEALDRVVPNSTKIFWLPGNHECISKDSEILTSRGWISAAKVSIADSVAQFDIHTGEITYANPLATIKKFSKSIMHVDSVHMSQAITKNHRLVVDNNFLVAKDLLINSKKQNNFILNGILHNEDCSISDELLRLLVWTVLDCGDTGDLRSCGSIEAAEIFAKE